MSKQKKPDTLVIFAETEGFGQSVEIAPGQVVPYQELATEAAAFTPPLTCKLWSEATEAEKTERLNRAIMNRMSQEPKLEPTSEPKLEPKLEQPEPTRADVFKRLMTGTNGTLEGVKFTLSEGPHRSMTLGTSVFVPGQMLRVQDFPRKTAQVEDMFLSGRIVLFKE